jgi:hypothetical protein
MLTGTSQIVLYAGMLRSRNEEATPCGRANRDAPDAYSAAIKVENNVGNNLSPTAISFFKAILHRRTEIGDEASSVAIMHRRRTGP